MRWKEVGLAGSMPNRVRPIFHPARQAGAGTWGGGLGLAWLMVICLVSHAETPTETPTISASLDSHHTRLGVPVELQVTLSFPPAWSFEMAELGSRWGEAQVLSSQWSEPERDPASGEFVAALKAQLAWYSLGDKEIDPLILNAFGPDGKMSSFETPRMMVQVEPSLSPNDDRLAPPKQPISSSPPSDWPWPGLLMGAMLFIAILAFSIRVIQNRRRPSLEIPLSPRQQVLKELYLLTHGPLLKSGDDMTFFVEIQRIIRGFFSRVLNTRTKEMTSSDLDAFLATRSEVTPDLRAMSQSFNALCDAVKFARYQPDEAAHTHVVNLAYEMVDLLVPREDEDVASG